ncbi:MAG: hypothetical protein LIR46_01350 [Bacteroidota bacterium]|nr:hypothetical protein [Bacteroidota bacterium]
MTKDNLIQEIDTMISNRIDDFLYLFSEYREICTRVEIAHYIAEAVSKYSYDLAYELDEEDEEG